MENQTIESGDNGQLVTFRLGIETYGIDIFKIQEVLHFRKITSIPNAPEQRIVILDMERPLGIIVDDISKVLQLDASQYEALPEAVVGDHDGNCIARLARTEEELIIVISPERILTRRESKLLETFEDSHDLEQVDNNDDVSPDGAF